jgi:hypothetical protein
MGVGLITYGTTNFNFVNSQAALIAPTNWNLRYRHASSGNWRLENDALTGLTNVGYNRTGSSPNFNYQMGLGGLGIDSNSTSIIPVGMKIEMGFASSNVGGWTSSGFGLYYPTSTYLGSDDNVGAIDRKFFVKITNNTKNNYLFYLDLSSTDNVDSTYTLRINSIDIINRPSSFYYLYDNDVLGTMYLPSYSNLEFLRQSTSSETYFDAWYLQDLGVSAAYTAGQADNDNYDLGYDDGYDDGFDYGVNVGAEFTYPEAYEVGYGDGVQWGYNNPPMTSLFTSVFAGIAQIFNIGIFGQITLGTIIIAPIAVALLWFILGIVSGVGNKK